jgi:hypothetical protein
MLVVTPLALITGQVTHAANVGTPIRDRAFETALGAAVGVVLTLAQRDAAETP